jgi:hypothetical protein
MRRKAQGRSTEKGVRVCAREGDQSAAESFKCQILEMDTESTRC